MACLKYRRIISTKTFLWQFFSLIIWTNAKSMIVAWNLAVVFRLRHDCQLGLAVKSIHIFYYGSYHSQFILLWIYIHKKNEPNYLVPTPRIIFLANTPCLTRKYSSVSIHNNSLIYNSVCFVSIYILNRDAL